MVCGVGQLAIGALPAVQVKATVTLELFQPLALGDGEAEAVIFGGPALVTVKFAPLLGTPDTVTTTFPVVAPLGTEARMLVALHDEGLARVPLNVRVLVP